MYQIIFNETGKPIEVTSDFNHVRAEKAQGRKVRNRNDLGCMAEAKAFALYATELTGEQFIPVDRGSSHHPRYDFVKAPKVGEEVSYAFNGDYYPCGKITKVSASLRRVETSEGRVFWRRKLTASWINNGTWSMVQGHIDRRNPSF